MVKALPVALYVAGVGAFAVSCLSSYQATAAAQYGQTIAYNIGAFCYFDPTAYSCNHLTANLATANKVAQACLDNSYIAAAAGVTSLSLGTIYSCFQSRIIAHFRDSAVYYD
ncbi:MAG: hypothetical protein LLF94_10920 [Chlamydiales bacterium]|nr:hypothetical protein [Chlamydiales bacterium]